MRVCIVGAGNAGICAAKHALSNNFEPTIFERSEQIGGTWQYTDETGIDKYGIEVHTSMYKNLRTNLPKEVMGFPDYPIPEQPKSYVTSEEMLEFLNSYADAFAVRPHVKFLHYVQLIRPVDNKWEITVKNLNNNETRTELFEFVMICNGHYNTPSYPSIKGMNEFKGKKIHSHDYRDPANYKDETVLVIGAGPSGMDIANSVSKFAKLVLLSHHLKEKPKTNFEPNVMQKPDVVSFTKSGATFTDNSFAEITTILYCTGYKYSFPFLAPECGIVVEDNHVQFLYKHCINIKFPTMAFIGLPFYVCACQMMDIQARFVMEFFCNRKQISYREMLEDTEGDMQRRAKKGLQKHQAHMMGPDQEDYYTDLAKTAGIQNISPVMTKLHNYSSQRFLDDLLNFRDDNFKIIDENTFVKLN